MNEEVFLFMDKIFPSFHYSRKKKSIAPFTDILIFLE